MSTTMSQAEFRASMDARLANVLSRLSASAAAYQPTIPPVGTRPAADAKKTEGDFPEVETDQVNDPYALTSTAKRVAVSPTPDLATAGVTTVDTPILADVPLVRARPSEGFEHTTAVQSTLAGIDGAKVHFSNVVKQANSNLRGEGDLAANIAITLGQDATESTEATVTALSGRIAAARIAVRKGALAARLPSSGMDVRLSVLRTVAADQRAWPDHSTVYIPSGMSDAGGAALVSLLVVGGPSAYVWRYPAGVGDPGLQPAVVRWGWPGGSNRLLVVSETDRDWNVVFGGAALSETSLTEVENYFRRAWGDGVFDEGWRTAFTLSGVYSEPEEGDYNFGRDFIGKDVTRIWQIDGDDIRGDLDWFGPSDIPAAPDERTRGVFTSMPPVYHAQLGQPTYRAWVAAFGANFPHDARPDAGQYASHIVDVRGVTFTDAGGHIWRATWDDLLDDRMEDEDLLVVLRRAAQVALRAAFGEGLAAPDLSPVLDPEQTEVRNVFGQNDRAHLLLPRLRLVSVLALVAGISVTVPGKPVQRYLDNTNMRTVCLGFGAHLHFCFMLSLSRQYLEPAVLRALPLPGAVGMLGVPPTLRSACVPRMMSEHEYEGGNLECLENGGIFRTFRNTPFAGFAVEGTWGVDMGIVKVNDAGNSYAALDAAARATWSTGGRINVHTRLDPAVQLSVIVSLENFVNPFAMPRFVRGDRGVEGLTVQAASGNNALLAGRSMDMFLWNSY